jgi:hypothetical protein
MHTMQLRQPHGDMFGVTDGGDEHYPRSVPEGLLSGSSVHEIEEKAHEISRGRTHVSNDHCCTFTELYRAISAPTTSGFVGS